MSFIAYAYVTVFLLLVIVEFAFVVNGTIKTAPGVYDFLSGMFLIAITVLYAYGQLRDRVSIWFVAPIIPVIIFDFYKSMTEQAANALTEAHQNDPELPVEATTVISLLFTAPAYICGVLLLIYKWQHYQ